MRRWGFSLAAWGVGGFLVLHFLERLRPLMGEGGAGFEAALPLLGMMSGFIVMGVGFARPVAEKIGEAAASLFFSDRRYAGPQPAYGVPEGYAIRGDVEGALRLYREIAAAHPGESRPWEESLALTWHVLRDEARSRALLAEGMAALPPARGSRLAEFDQALRAGRVPNRYPHLGRR